MRLLHNRLGGGKYVTIFVGLANHQALLGDVITSWPYAIVCFVGAKAFDFAMADASLVSGLLPALILYLFLSGRFIEGLTAGALKG
jgi:ABC-type glycerol-3-phosphate transport system permease component